MENEYQSNLNKVMKELENTIIEKEQITCDMNQAVLTVTQLRDENTTLASRLGERRGENDALRENKGLLQKTLLDQISTLRDRVHNLEGQLAAAGRTSSPRTSSPRTYSPQRISPRLVSTGSGSPSSSVPRSPQSLSTRLVSTGSPRTSPRTSPPNYYQSNDIHNTNNIDTISNSTLKAQIMRDARARTTQHSTKGNERVHISRTGSIVINTHLPRSISPLNATGSTTMHRSVPMSPSLLDLASGPLY